MTSKESFQDFSPETVAALRFGEERAQKRQRRQAGDIALNRYFDQKLEAALKEICVKNEIGEAFKEFVQNEKLRYSAGIAGKGAKDFRQLFQRKAELENEIGTLETLETNLVTERKLTRQLKVDLDVVSEESKKTSDALRASDEKYSALEKAHADLNDRFDRFIKNAHRIIQSFLRKIQDHSVFNSLKQYFVEINREIPQEMAPLKLDSISKGGAKISPDDLSWQSNEIKTTSVGINREFAQGIESLELNSIARGSRNFQRGSFLNEGSVADDPLKPGVKWNWHLKKLMSQLGNQPRGCGVDRWNAADAVTEIDAEDSIFEKSACWFDGTVNVPLKNVRRIVQFQF